MLLSQSSSVCFAHTQACIHTRSRSHTHIQSRAQQSTSLVSVWQLLKTQWWETDFPHKTELSCRATLVTHTKTQWNSLRVKMSSSTSPPFPAVIWRWSLKKTYSENLAGYQTHEKGCCECWWMNFFFCKVSPHPHLTGGERGNVIAIATSFIIKGLHLWPGLSPKAAQLSLKRTKGK